MTVLIEVEKLKKDQILIIEIKITRATVAFYKTMTHKISNKAFDYAI